MESSSDMQATLLQLQARLEILENLKLEMTEELENQKLHFEITCKNMDNITEKFCNSVIKFVNNDTIYAEAKKRRQQLTNTDQLQLQEAIVKLDREMTQWKNAKNMLFTEQAKAKSLEDEIEELYLKKQEISLKVKFCQESLEKLMNDKEKVNEYPTKDVHFLRLKETLATMKELERTNETTYFSLGGSCQ